MKLKITKENAGKRIDKFLFNLFQKESPGEFSRMDFSRFIKDGKVLINDKEVKVSRILKENDDLKFNLSAGKAGIYNSKTKKKRKLIPNTEIKFKIIYEDENIVAVDKPAGLSVHPSLRKEKAEDTLINGLIAKYPEIVGVGDDSVDAWMRPGMVHRLDKDTSGVMVLARNQKSFNELKKLFKERKVKKKYWAVVYGRLKKKKGIIDAPIARAATYKKQVIAGRKTKTKIRDAVTKYKVLKEFDGYSLAEVRPKTGRMHQIRVHFFHIGHPIIGDQLYRIRHLKFRIENKDKKQKGKKRANLSEVKRQMLHAREIEFILFGKKYFFISEIPRDMRGLID